MFHLGPLMLLVCGLVTTQKPIGRASHQSEACNPNYPGRTVVLGRSAEVRILLGMRARVSPLVQSVPAARRRLLQQFSLLAARIDATEDAISTGSVAQVGATCSCLAAG